MDVQVKVFGQLTDITGHETIGVENVTDINSLLENLNKKFPQLADTKFAIAVDKKVITENILLHRASTIVLMPPFSGG